MDVSQSLVKVQVLGFVSHHDAGLWGVSPWSGGMRKEKLLVTQAPKNSSQIRVPIRRLALQQMTI